MRHINTFWGPKMGVGGKKFILKTFTCFFCPHGKAPGGTSRKFRGIRAEVPRSGPGLLESCLDVQISIRNPSEATFEKVQVATRLGATGLRASEGNLPLRVSLREPPKTPEKSLRTSEKISEKETETL